MKINQWTLGLAAVGVVSLASAVNAEEAKMNAVQTALSSTTISGYVDTSVEWTLGNKNSGVQSGIPFRGGTSGFFGGSSPGKSDGFNLNVVKLSIEKSMDESEWASGYKADLLFGPDAVNYNSSVNGIENNNNTGRDNDFGIKQAYVALRTPVGNGIDWKMGVFDTIIGYETFEAGNNPNFSRSWGYSVEPTQHTGLLGTYRINDNIAVAAGIANTLSAGINDRADNNSAGVRGQWRKTVMASVAVTAPNDTGFLSGSTFYGGVVVGVNNAGGNGGNSDQSNFYLGATLNTPVTGLKAGVAFDYVNNVNGFDGEVWVAGLYGSYQATEKLSLHARGEYGNQGIVGAADGVLAGITATAQYDLWANVISRLELRWDQNYREGVNQGGAPVTGLGLYGNVIYKF